MIRNGQALLPRPQEDLGRAERTGREDHHVRRDRLLGGGELLAVVPERIEEHPPASALGAHIGDAHLGEDLGAVVVGVGDVGHLHSVLGADVAPSAAVAAQRAGWLLDACVVDLALERHVNRRPHDVLVHGVAADLERLQLCERLIVGIGHRPQHLLCARKALLARLIGGDLLRPYGVVPHARVGWQRNVGVDERAAAEAAADEDVDVVAEMQIIEPEARARDVEAVLGDLELLLRLDQAVGKIADGELAPALEHGNAFARTREPRGGYATAIARADDDHVVAQLQIADGLRQSPHGSSSPVPAASPRRHGARKANDRFFFSGGR